MKTFQKFRILEEIGCSVLQLQGHNVLKTSEVAHSKVETVEEEPQGKVFRNALPITGILHIIHNVGQQMHLDLPYWPPFWAHLKNLEALLGHKWRLQRYLGTCVPEGVEPPAAIHQVNAKLYEARWGCVAEFVSQVLIVYDFLVSTWSAPQYIHAVDSHRGEAEKQFDPHMLSEALSSTGFRLKLKTMQLVEQKLQSLSKWAEGCPCHSKMLSHLSRKQVETFLGDCLGGERINPHKLACPFASRRAPELAAGHIQDFFQELSQHGEAQLLSDPQSLQATESEQFEASTMFRHCVGRVFLFLKIKLAHWQQLPHVWCGMAHWDRAVAQQCAARGRDLYEQSRNAPGHHTLTITFCCSLRQDLDKFIDGTAALCLSQPFQEALAQLLFIPVSERSIESKHALVRGALQRSGLKGSTVRLSFANRMPELHTYLHNNYDQMPCLLECFEKARHHRRVPALLGLDAHPLIAALPAGTRSSHYTKILRAILYRADVDSQTWSLTCQHATHSDLLALDKAHAAQLPAAHGAF